MITQKRYYIKAAFSAALILFLFENFQTKKREEKVTCFFLIYNFPINSFQENGKTTYYYNNDTIKIYSFCNYILYRLAENRNFETDEKIVGTETYFAYKKESDSGFFFNSLKELSVRTKLPVDSFLRARAMKGDKAELLDTSSFWKLSEKISDAKKDFFIEKYIPIKKPDETCFDSVYYYYTNNLNDIDYTFSSKIDRARKMKLYKLRFLYNEYFSPIQNQLLPKREISVEMRKSDVENPQEMINFFDRFKKIQP